VVVSRGAAIEARLAQSLPSREEGDRLLAQGNYSGAIAAYRRAIQSDPSDGYTYSRLGQALTEDGNYAEAIDVHQEAIRRSPQDTYAYTYLSITLWLSGQLAAAAAACQQGIKLNSDNAPAYKLMGQILRDQGKLSDSVAAYRKAIQRAPQDAGSYSGLGDSFKAQGQMREAIAAYRQALTLAPQLAGVYLDLGDALTSQNQFAEAIANYGRAVELDPTYLNALISLGDRLRQQNQLDAALSAYSSAIRRIGPDRPSDLVSLYRQMAQVLSLQGKHTAAIAVLQKAEDLAPNQAEIKGAIAGQQAILQAQVEVDRAPQTLPPYLALGQALERQEAHAAATAAYQRATSLEPKNFVPWVWLAGSLQRQGQGAKAANAARQALQRLPKPLITPENQAIAARGHGTLGRALLSQNQLEAAITSFRTGFTLDPQLLNDTDALQFAYALGRRAQYPEAATWLRWGLARAPGRKDLQDALASTERLLGGAALSAPNSLTPSVLQAVVQICAPEFPAFCFGTGWMIQTRQGRAIIVTNRHVVTQPGDRIPLKDLDVEFHPSLNGTTLRRPAKLLRKTEPTDLLDLAVLEVANPPSQVRPLPLNLTPPNLGDWVTMVGHPFNQPPWTVAQGQVGVRGAGQPSQNLQRFQGNRILLNIAIASGNSGSPLLDPKQQVVGMVAKAPRNALQFRDGNFTASQASAERLDVVLNRMREWGFEF
jgi:tetratricopeptide (TPR) repeat protein